MLDEEVDRFRIAPLPVILGPPPLRIHHILVATAVVAANLALNKYLIDIDSLGMGGDLQRGDRVLSMVTSGLALTLLGFGIAWRLGGRSFFDQPGHWLLLLQLFIVFFYLMLAVSSLIGSDDGPTFSPLAIGAYVVLLLLGWPTINFAAAWMGFRSRWWRWFFILQGVTYFVLILSARFVQSSPILSIAPSGLMLALMTVASVADLRRGRKRDWPHWVGVIITSTGLAVGIATAIWQSIGASP